MSKALFMRELDFLHKNVALYLGLFPDDRHDWSPAPNLRSLFSLASHLAGGPEVGLAILEGRPNEEVYALDEPVKSGGRAELVAYFDRAMSALKAHVAALSDEEYASKQLRDPFVEGTVTPEQVVMGTITHLYHHRGQYHNYLKELGVRVDTNTVYATE